MLAFNKKATCNDYSNPLSVQKVQKRIFGNLETEFM